jgi:hypothetical protein
MREATKITIKAMAEDKITLGMTYEDKYLKSSQHVHRELEAKLGFVKTYLVRNHSRGPVFKGMLSVMADGRAVMEVSYVSYGGRKNKYVTFFDKEGREIKDSLASMKLERKYWDAL